MHDTIKSMVTTLSQSVTGIVAAGTPDQADLLNKGFGEFEGALAKFLDGEMERAVAAVPKAEEPLFKGLGCVGRVANLTAYIAREVKNIQEGVDYQGQSSKDNTDPASEEVGDMLDNLVGMAELTLRASVNEHVDLPEDGDFDDIGKAAPTLPAGTRLIKVASADAPDDEILLKTALPDGLAKYATDPALISESLVEIGAAAMLLGGVPDRALQKFFAGDALAKAAGEADGGGEGVTEDLGAGDEEGGGEEDGSDMDPLEIVGRLAAAIMFQVDQLQQAVNGGAADDGVEEGGDEAVAGEVVPGADEAEVEDVAGKDEEDPEKKPPFGKSADPAVASLRAELAKMTKTLDAALAKKAPEKPAQRSAEMADLQKSMADMQARITKLGAAPAPSRAVVGPAASHALSKAVDTGGVDMGAALEAEQARLAKMSPEARTQELIKMTLRNGGAPLDPRLMKRGEPATT